MSQIVNGKKRSTSETILSLKMIFTSNKFINFHHPFEPGITEDRDAGLLLLCSKFFVATLL
jgi:hypothetical protein